jgi:hypothetical protein
MRKPHRHQTLSPDLPDYVAVRLQDAAPVLGLAVGTLQKKCATGKIPIAFKTSGDRGDWRIHFSFLRPYLLKSA